MLMEHHDQLVQPEKEKVTVNLPVSYEGYDDQVLKGVTFERTVDVIDPAWQALVDDGTITEELLADVSEPDDVKLARLIEEALQAEDAQWSSFGSNGIAVTITGKPSPITVIATDERANQLLGISQTYKAQLQIKSDLVFNLTDKDGRVHPLTPSQFAEFEGQYMLAFLTEREAYQARKVAIQDRNLEDFN